MLKKLIHPDNENDVALVEPGGEAEALHRGRGLVDEAELEALKKASGAGADEGDEAAEGEPKPEKSKGKKKG